MRALQVYRRFNATDPIYEERGALVLIEKWADPDGRRYRLEYRSVPDAAKAVAICLHNPWGGRNGGEDYHVGHVAEDGFICLRSGYGNRTLSGSPVDLEFVILRARFWCACFSYLKEHGAWPAA